MVKSSDEFENWCIATRGWWFSLMFMCTWSEVHVAACYILYCTYTLCWLRDLDLWPTNRASSRYVVPVTSLLSCLKTPVHHTAHFFVLALLGCDVDRWPDIESHVISLFIRPDGTRMQADSERPTLWSWNRTLYSIIRAPRFIIQVWSFRCRGTFLYLTLTFWPPK